MPGFWGAGGEALGRFPAFHHAHEDIWGRSPFLQVRTCAVGAHCHRGGSAITQLRSGEIVAFDGEHSLYREDDLAPDCLALLKVLHDSTVRKPSLRGNAAIVGSSGEDIVLFVDDVGTFPLYIVELPAGILFGSLLRPIAYAVGETLDALAVVEFLHSAYLCAGRTLIRSVRRLQPGQVARWRPDTGLRVIDTSTLWTSPHPTSTPADPVESSWTLLSAQFARSVPNDTIAALFVSAGWDSRTLLASLQRHPTSANILAYSHGDLSSREIRIAERLCRLASIPHRRTPINNDILDWDRVGVAFARTETALFLHWTKAGALLADSGVQCAIAGVLGEILGGHYGTAMVSSGAQRITAVLRPLLGLPESHDRRIPLEAVHRHLLLPNFAPPFGLRQDFVDSIDSPLEQLNAGIEIDVRQLWARGIRAPTRLLEAFISEHRGTQYINAQLLACRAFLDVTAPFADSALLELASSIPLTQKIHNRINRLMLLRYAPKYASLPLAATLIPAALPISVQEVSRLARKVWEEGRWRAHFLSGRRIAPPRLGWVNFEFLRDGVKLREIVESLESDFWDRKALLGRIDDVVRFEWKEQLHPIFDYYSRILTVDMMLRRVALQPLSRPGSDLA